MIRPDRKLVLFDVDGTLVDSAALIHACMLATFADLGRAPPDRNQILSVIGLSLDEGFGVLLGGHSTREDRAAASALYKGHFQTFRQSDEIGEPLFAGVATTLAALAKRPDILIGLVTGKSRGGVAHVLGRFGWHSLFATIQTADDAPSKPHPAMVLQAMRETGTVPTRTIVIGDTTFDMEMAVAAGARGIGVSWGNHPVPALRKAGATAILDNFTELDRHLS